MLNIPESVKALFKSDGVRKNFRVHFPNGELNDITNENIVTESVKFTESVCSQGVFRFGCAESSVLEFETVGISNMYGMMIEASYEIDTTSLSASDIAAIQAGTWDGTLVLSSNSDLGYGFFRVPIGVFRVESCPRDHAALAHRRVTAYTTRLSDVMQPFEYWKQNGIAYSIPKFKYYSIEALFDANNAWKTPDVLNGRYTKTKYTNKTTDIQEVKFDQTYTLTSGTLRVVIRWWDFYHTILDALVLPTNVNISSVELDDFSAADAESWVSSTLEQMGISDFEDFLMSQMRMWLYPYIRGIDSGYDTARNFVIDGSETPYIYPPADGYERNNYAYAWSKMGIVYAPTEYYITLTYTPTGGVAQSETSSFTVSPSGDAIACYYYHKVDSSNEQEITIESTGSFQKNGRTYYTYADSYDFLSLLMGYAEMRGTFARETRTGSVEIKALNPNNPEAILPQDYLSVWWDEFNVDPIGSVIAAYSEEDDEVVTSIRIGDGKSVYEMTDNDLLKTLADGSESKVLEILQGSFAENASVIGFTPVELNYRCFPWVEAGDALRITSEDNVQVDTFALRIETTGIQHIVSSITAQSGKIFGGDSESVSMSYGGGETPERNMQIDFLWENQTPSSDFAAQTVSLDLSPYNFVIVVATATSSDTNGGFAYGRVADGLEYNIVLRNYNTSNSFSYVRRFTVNSNGIVFTTGLRDTTAGANYAIPRAIYGVRF